MSWRRWFRTVLTEPARKPDCANYLRRCVLPGASRHRNEDARRAVPAPEFQIHRTVPAVLSSVPARKQGLGKQQIPPSLNFTPTSAKTALVGDPGSAGRDDNSKS